MNPTPGLGGLRIAHTIVVLVLLAQNYLVATRQNHGKVDAWREGAVTAVVGM